MLTLLMIVFAVVVAAGVCVVAWAAFTGCLWSSLWLCCGGLGHCAELLGELVAAILKGLTE